MSIENRLQHLEDIIIPKSDKFQVFVFINHLGGHSLGRLLVCNRSHSTEFDNKKDFLIWANNNEIEAEEIKRLCSKLNWD